MDYIYQVFLKETLKFFVVSQEYSNGRGTLLQSNTKIVNSHWTGSQLFPEFFKGRYIFKIYCKPSFKFAAFYFTAAL